MEPRDVLRALVLNTVRETATGLLKTLDEQGVLQPSPPAGTIAEIVDRLVETQAADWDKPEVRQMIDKILAALESER